MSRGPRGAVAQAQGERKRHHIEVVRPSVVVAMAVDGNFVKSAHAIAIPPELKIITSITHHMARVLMFCGIMWPELVAGSARVGLKHTTRDIDMI